MPVNTPPPDVRERPVTTPDASRWMLSGSSAVVATRCRRPRSMGSAKPFFWPRMRSSPPSYVGAGDAVLLAQDARPPAAAHVRVLHRERERLPLEGQPADGVHV